MSWYSEKPIKATRKPHKCAGCLKAIPTGTASLYISGYDPSYCDAPFYGHYHPECRVAENAMNEAAGVLSGDEWMFLHEHAAEDPKWLLGNFPAVAARFNIGDAA